MAISVQGFLRQQQNPNCWKGKRLVSLYQLKVSWDNPIAGKMHQQQLRQQRQQQQQQQLSQVTVHNPHSLKIHGWVPIPSQVCLKVRNLGRK